MNERNLPTERRVAAVELLLSLGYTWDGNKWNTRPTAVASHAEVEVVAEVVSAHGDPESFGEREIRIIGDLSKIPYNTKLYANPPRSGDDGATCKRSLQVEDARDAARIVLVDGDPYKGKEYIAGEWSMRNYEAMMRDQKELVAMAAQGES